MIVLASSSPRRQELLHRIVDDFIIDVPDIDESIITGDVMELAKLISLEKAKTVAKRHPNDIVIASDTIVVYNDEILGKPKDINDARRMLKMLSNDKHIVITGYAIINRSTIINDQDISTVVFNKISDELIESYLQTGSPMDKAGAYGIQDKDFSLVKHIEGSYFNVMGFPLEKIEKILKNRQ